MRTLILPVAVTALAVSIGCDRKTATPTVTVTSEGEVSHGPAGKEAAKDSVGLVRLLNADSRGKPRSLWLDKTLLFSNVEYKSLTAFTQVPRIAARIRIREDGEKADLAGTNLEILPGRHYTLVAVQGKDGASHLLNLSGDLTPPASGNVKVRIINASSVDNLDLFRAGSGTKVHKGIDAPGHSDFEEVPAGIFEIRAARMPVDPGLLNLVLEAGKSYTLVVTGDAGTLRLMEVEDSVKITEVLR